MHSFAMFFRRPKNSSAPMNTTRHLDAYLSSHSLLHIFRIFSPIKPSIMANLSPTSHHSLVARPTTTSTSLRNSLLVLNKPLQQQQPRLSKPKLSALLRLRRHLVPLPPVQQPLPRLVTAAQIPAQILRVKLFTQVLSRLTKVLSIKATKSSSIHIVRQTIPTTVRSATLQFLTALTSARCASLLNLLLARHHVRLSIATLALSSATKRPIVCNFPPPGWQRMLQSADFLGCPGPLLLRMPFFYPVCKN